MFELIRPGTQIDFVGKRKLWLGISAVAVAATFVLFFTKGMNYGIDFTGGAEVQIKVPASWDISKVRTELETGGVKNSKVQQIGLPQDSQFLVKAAGDEGSLNLVSKQVGDILSKSLKSGEFEIQRVDVV